VAVLGVVIYHAFPQNLPGGFCGVDIFFVISGYLISGILYKSGGQGEFSFREFYERRARRLFPSLITMLMLCLGYGYFVLLSDEYRKLGGHVAAGTLFIQNLVFWQESGYWDVTANLKPLLHLWSLAVEEQFYIFFPPLLLLIWKRRWPMLPLLLILMTLSLIANMIMSGVSREADFFLTPYRAWEFLAGSLLAWWHYGKDYEEEAPLGNFLSVAGVTLLALSMILLKEKEPYPSWRAMLPVAGSVALIAAGKRSWINRTILSHPAAVWVGLISYPLYLFHWPALSFVHIIKGSHPADIYLAGALIVAFLLTIFTYYLVEKPCRFSKSKATILFLSGAFILTGFFGFIVWRMEINSSISPKANQIARAMNDKNYFDGWTVNKKADKVLLASIGGSGAQVLFLGDSNTWQYAPRIKKLLDESSNKDQGVLMLGSGGVPPIPGLENPEYPQSKNLMKRFQQLLTADPRIKVIVIGARWDLYLSPYEKLPFYCSGSPIYETKGRVTAIKNLGQLIHELVGRGVKVILLLGVPTGHEFDPKNAFKRDFSGFNIKGFPKFPQIDYLLKYSPDGTRDLMRKIGIENGATVIDPMHFLCRAGLLIMENQEGPIRYDEGHLTSGFVRDNVKYLDQVVAP